MKNILKIVSISKPLHKLVLIIGSLILTGALLDLIPPILSKFIVDEIVKKLNNQGGSVTFLAVLIGIGFHLILSEPLEIQ